MAVSCNVLLTLLLLTGCNISAGEPHGHRWRAFLLVENFEEPTMDAEVELAEKNKIIVDDSE